MANEYDPNDLPLNMATKMAVDPETGCWVWFAARTAGGYGNAWHPATGAAQYAHRRSYELLAGAIPDGLTIDHLCRNKPCINPAHMEPVLRVENKRRDVVARNPQYETHYPCGHERSAENTAKHSRAGGQPNPRCLTCQRARGREYKRRKREAVATCPR